MAIATLRTSKAWRDERRHVLERQRRRAPAEETELRVLARHDACLEALLRFETTAEAPEERGRRRLWCGYRKGGVDGAGRGRHHGIGGARPSHDQQAVTH